MLMFTPLTSPKRLKLLKCSMPTTASTALLSNFLFPDPTQTEEILNAVAPQKDVDGLRSETSFDAPTPTAISWLLAGYNINLSGKHIVVIGQGRLVGKPLTRMWEASGLEVTVADRATEDLATLVKDADVIVTATGKPGLLTSAMIQPNAVVVDAGVATDSNGLVGGVTLDVRDRSDLTIYPRYWWRWPLDRLRPVRQRHQGGPCLGELTSRLCCGIMHLMKNQNV